MSDWPHTVTTNVGSIFKENHLTLNVTDAQFAKSLGVTPQAVRSLRSGIPHWEFTTEMPRTRNAYQRLAKTYGIDANKLAAAIRNKMNIATRHRSGQFKTDEQKAKDYRGLRSRPR